MAQERTGIVVGTNKGHNIYANSTEEKEKTGVESDKKYAVETNLKNIRTWKSLEHEVHLEFTHRNQQSTPGDDTAAYNKTTPLNTPKNKISRSKGKSSRRTAFVREIAREVVGLAPYERRVIELLRNAQDKRARKLAKKRLGTFVRGKRKVEDMQKVIAEARRTTGH
ncbi:ribosomal protein L36 [Penicillium ochrochloron]